MNPVMTVRGADCLLADRAKDPSRGFYLYLGLVHCFSLAIASNLHQERLLKFVSSKEHFMPSLQSNIYSKVGLLPVIFLGMLMLSACGDDTTGTDETCGGNGVFHGDHCDCDAGYSPSADGLSCEADEVSADDTNAGDNQTSDVSDAANLTFNPSSTKASVGQNQDGSQVWIFEAMDGDAMLRFELYAAYGAPTSPGVAEITDAETDYSTCGTCIMLRTGCVAHGDHYDCTKSFMPKVGGQIEFTAISGTVGEQMSGELKNIVLQEVSIAQDYSTTPVNGGEALSIDSWAFDVSLEAL